MCKLHTRTWRTWLHPKPDKSPAQAWGVGVAGRDTNKGPGPASMGVLPPSRSNMTVRSLSLLFPRPVGQWVFLFLPLSPGPVLLVCGWCLVRICEGENL